MAGAIRMRLHFKGIQHADRLAGWMSAYPSRGHLMREQVISDSEYDSREIYLGLSESGKCSLKVQSDR